MTETAFWPRCRASLEVVLDGRGAPNSRPIHLEADCYSANVSLNGFYEADTFEAEFDMKILPLDPDAIAYCAVRIYMWDAGTSSGEWAIDDNLMIKGLVDNVSSSVVGSSTILKFVGRDYTAILADPDWDSQHQIPAGIPLDKSVQRIADQAAPEGTTARFEVVWRGDGNPPIVGAYNRKSKKFGISVKPGKTYWDTIWDLCMQHSYVARVEGSQIIISEPHTETRESLRRAARLVYGKSLYSLEITRNFHREIVPQIVIRAYANGKHFEVRFPDKRNVDRRVTAQRDERDALGIPLTSKKDEVRYYAAPKGVVDPEALKRLARMRFYHLGRGETIYTLETYHLSVPGPDGEVNLLQLRPGAPIGIDFEPFKTTQLRELEYGERVEAITSMGYARRIAEFLAANLDRLELFKQEYYYNRGTIDWSITEGISIKIEAVNFAGEVREILFAEG